MLATSSVVCLFIWLYTTLSTFVYFEQAHIIANAVTEPAERTRLFAFIDLGVNTLTILLQIWLTGRLIRTVGLPWTLALVPASVVLGFLALGLAPVLPVLVVFQVLRRAGNYGLTRPAREVLFTVVGRDAKYKAKNFIDTVVYRGGDALSGWLFAGLMAMGFQESTFDQDDLYSRAEWGIDLSPAVRLHAGFDLERRKKRHLFGYYRAVAC